MRGEEGCIKAPSKNPKGAGAARGGVECTTKAAPVTGTTLRTTGLVPADSRQ